MTPACSIELKPSRLLAGTAAVLHFLALGSVWTGLSGPALGAAAAGIVLSGVWTVGDALLLWPSSVRRLELDESGSGRWTDRRDGVHPVAATRAGWVGARIVVLGLEAPRRGTRWIVLAPDSADPEPLRRLRTWLRWRPA